MKSYEFFGKTVEKAIKEGLSTLNKNQEDVDIKIISEGGFFKKAKVVINVDEEPMTHFVETKVEEKVLEVKPQTEVIEKKQEKSIEKNVKEDNKEPEKQEKQVLSKEKIENEHRVLPSMTVEEREKQFEEKHFENNTTSQEFLEGLLKLIGVEGKVTLEEKKDCSEFVIETADAGKVIGYRGEALSSIQYLANIIEGNKSKNAKRVVIDAGDYKKKREENLRALAIRIAGKVEETGRPYKLEPMNAFERRIIHTELQNYSAVDTHSEGVEPRRYIVVTKK